MKDNYITKEHLKNILLELEQVQVDKIDMLENFNFVIDKVLEIKDKKEADKKLKEIQIKYRQLIFEVMKKSIGITGLVAGILGCYEEGEIEVRK